MKYIFTKLIVILVSTLFLINSWFNIVSVESNIFDIPENSVKRQIIKL